MIHIVQKQYQVVLWRSEQRTGPEVSLRLDFDTLDEAKAALSEHRASGFYRSGVLMEWRKTSGIWNLVEQYPSAAD